MIALALLGGCLLESRRQVEERTGFWRMTRAAGDNSGFLPDAIRLEWIEVIKGLARMRRLVERRHMAPNGFLHAASVIGLADSASGPGCMAARPDGATSFTTLELKSNFLSSARKGEGVAATARLVHGGRTTQVWDAEVSNESTGKTIALFRCTQLLIYPKVN